jgi:hypothetical protein
LPLIGYGGGLSGDAVWVEIGLALKGLAPILRRNTRSEQKECQKVVKLKNIPGSARTNFHVVDGEGHSLVGGKRLDWEDKDVFTVPTWTFCEHVNSGDRSAYLFSFSDVPVMRALSLYREETRQSAAR